MVGDGSTGELWGVPLGLVLDEMYSRKRDVEVR